MICFAFEWSVRPQGPLPDKVKQYPGHAHPVSEERIRIVSGKIWFRSGGVEKTMLEGQEVIVPPGTPHSWWNVGDTEANAIVEFRPAGEIKSFFETTFGLAKDGELGKGFKTMLRYAVILLQKRRQGPTALRARGRLPLLAAGKTLRVQFKIFRQADCPDVN